MIKFSICNLYLVLRETVKEIAGILPINNKNFTKYDKINIKSMKIAQINKILRKLKILV